MIVSCLMWDWELNSGLLEEQQVLLSTKLPFKPFKEGRKHRQREMREREERRERERRMRERRQKKRKERREKERRERERKRELTLHT